MCHGPAGIFQFSNFARITLGRIIFSPSGLSKEETQAKQPKFIVLA